MSILKLPLVAATLLAVATPASAELFVSGDTNLLAAVNDAEANERFILNLAGDGVVVLHPGQIAGFATTDLSFVLGNAGVPHLALGWNAPVTADDLVGASLYMSYMKATPWTAAEADLLVNFLAGGGHVLLAGDHGFFENENAAVNGLLTAMGSQMRIVEDRVGDVPFEIATIQEANGFTTGTEGLRYILTSQVSGGRPLYGSADGSVTIIAYEALSAAVPEPASWAMLIIGFGAVGAALRRDRRLPHMLS